MGKKLMSPLISKGLYPKMPEKREELSNRSPPKSFLNPAIIPKNSKGKIVPNFLTP